MFWFSSGEALLTVLFSSRSAVAAAMTVVRAWARLLFGSESDSEAVTWARLVKVPTALGVTTTVTVATAVPLNEPRLQVIVRPAVEHEPWLGVMELTVTPAGNVSVIVTFVAVPAAVFFVTVSVYVNG